MKQSFEHINRPLTSEEPLQVVALDGMERASEDVADKVKAAAAATREVATCASILDMKFVVNGMVWDR